MDSDFLVIGSGIAGLIFAINAKKYGRVKIITKKEAVESNTNYAQGGLAAPLGEGDSFNKHIKDTLITGDGLCHRDIVELIVKEANNVIKELEEIGVKFDKSSDNKYDLGMEGGHSFRRIVHCKDATGREIESVLVNKAKELGIEIFENFLAIDLIMKNNRCIGVTALNLQDEKIYKFFAKSTLLATGGIGKVYLHTTNPEIATGDGISMAYRAGAKIANMEFIQFHPTALYGKKINGKAFLISESVRGEGGILKLISGKQFMDKYDERKELASRDIVARAIYNEMKNSGEKYVLLDIRHLGEKRIKEKFPTIYENCLKLGIDITKEPIPVTPAAHYVCGGIFCDSYGKTNIDGLYTAGECGCTGLHGANRLASNSLLESVVIAKRAAEKVKEEKIFVKEIKNVLENKGEKVNEYEIEKYLNEIQTIMWEKVGIVRNDKELIDAKNLIKKIEEKVEKLYNKHKITKETVEIRNIATVAKLIIECAIKRKESRGLHYNIDHPYKEKNFEKDTIIFCNLFNFKSSI